LEVLYAKRNKLLGEGGSGEAAGFAAGGVGNIVAAAFPFMIKTPIRGNTKACKVKTNILL
jgi:hypothetical protein